MISRVPIATKIWLSISIFILGFIISTSIGQMQGLSRERVLLDISRSFFPAAQRSVQAQGAFHEAVKDFNDAVLIQDATALIKAEEEGRIALLDLRAVSMIKKIERGRTQMARSLEVEIEQFLRDAHSTYGFIVQNGAGLSPATQQSMQDLATRITRINIDLKNLSGRLAEDLHVQLHTVEDQSAHQRLIELLIFFLTVGAASILVNLTIQRAITGPLLLMNAALSAARDKAETASRVKSDFLSTMSHEIRTPMNGVLGMTYLLLETKLSPEQVDYAQTVRSSAEALLAIINDILDFSKMEAGKMTIEPIAFDLGLALEEVVELLNQKASQKGLDFILGYSPNVPRRVIGDPGRIRQILVNLVGNAIKFTKRGHIFVSVECDESTTPISFRFSVEDTGIGIAAEKVGALFEKFTQADASTTRMYGGTGLGLAISKQLVELMGGQIEASSSVGEGSRFTFTLPLPLDRTFPTKRGAVLDLGGARVLIVDDNPVNLRIVAEHLAPHKVEITCTSSASEALTALRAAQAHNTPFHIAILDHLMPQTDGEMLGREIKADPSLSSVLLFMLTSSGQKSDRARFEAAGFSAYLVKPARPGLLIEGLQVLWSSIVEGKPLTEMVTRHSLAETRPAATVPNGAAALPHMRVLLAEDNLVNQKVAKRLLEKAGCQVDVAADGLEACEMWSKTSYDILFMDCQMPEMDGFTATGEIRRLERTRGGSWRTPIIALTANTMSGDKQKCFDAGMDDFIPKPIPLAELNRVLQKCARLKTVEGSEEVLQNTPA